MATAAFGRLQQPCQRRYWTWTTSAQAMIRKRAPSTRCNYGQTGEAPRWRRRPLPASSETTIKPTPNRKPATRHVQMESSRASAGHRSPAPALGLDTHQRHRQHRPPTTRAVAVTRGGIRIHGPPLRHHPRRNRRKLRASAQCFLGSVRSPLQSLPQRRLRLRPTCPAAAVATSPLQPRLAVAWPQERARPPPPGPRPFRDPATHPCTRSTYTECRTIRTTLSPTTTCSTLLVACGTCTMRSSGIQKDDLEPTSPIQSLGSSSSRSRRVRRSLWPTWA
mmetsp:Transcript_49758/g.105970  ORF Transcript_49758/g.105970 Transcript_49758/m.105970 type:complete len:278 (-) Transcript_49758:628-1461(-)